MTFYHYTCEHGRGGIGEQGMVRTLADWSPTTAQRLRENGIAPWLAGISWFTDLDTTDRLALGLTSHTMALRCDRMRFRYVVLDPADLRPWVRVARRIAPRADVDRLNANHGALPMHWYVCDQPVPAALDHSYTLPPLKGLRR